MSAEESAEQTKGSSPWKFELWLALGGLLFGLVILPALIYVVGTLVLGPYGEESGLLSMYGHLYADLFSGETRAWLLVVGPYLLVAMIRAIWKIGRGATGDGARPSVNATGDRHVEPQRVEPKVSWD